MLQFSFTRDICLPLTRSSRFTKSILDFLF